MFEKQKRSSVANIIFIAFGDALLLISHISSPYTTQYSPLPATTHAKTRNIYMLQCWKYETAQVPGADFS